MKTPPFWMVWRHDGGNPTKMHLSLIDAQAEAARLCRQERATFYVLAVSQCYEPVISVAAFATSYAPQEGMPRA